MPKTRRMLTVLGIGTILIVALLFLAYHFVLGPKGLSFEGQSDVLSCCYLLVSAF